MKTNTNLKASALALAATLGITALTLTGCSSSDETASGEQTAQSSTAAVEESTDQALADDEDTGDPEVDTLKITLAGESGGDWADSGSISVMGELNGGTITIVDKDGTVLESKSGSGYQSLIVDPLAQGEYQVEAEGVAIEDLYISAQTFDDTACAISVDGVEQTTASGTDYVSCYWSTNQE